MCMGASYLAEASLSAVSALSEHQCRLAGASWIFTRRLLWCCAWNDLNMSIASVGADCVGRALLDVGQPARHPALDVLYRGDARADHLEGRIERVEIEVDVADHQAGDEPQLERHVGRAELHRREADMVMAVDEARQQDLLASADHRRGRILPLQVVIGADGDDYAVLLQHGAVLDLVP